MIASAARIRRRCIMAFSKSPPLAHGPNADQPGNGMAGVRVDARRFARQRARPRSFESSPSQLPLACDRRGLKRIAQDPQPEVHLVEPLANPPHARDHCRRRHHRSAVWRGTPCAVADGRRPPGGSTGAVLRGTESLLTHRWRRQSAANSSRKWSSESQVFGVPTGKWALSPGGRPIYAIVITLIFRTQVLPRRLNFPSIKERGGSTRSKFVQNVRLFSQLRFKTHNIGSLATTINRGYCGRDT